MKKPILLAALACALLAPSVTPARLLLGGQVGIAPAWGDKEEAWPLSDDVRFAVPLELRAAWRLSPRLSVGLQGGWGWASVGEALDEECSDSGRDCTAHVWRVAARGEYAFSEGRWRPFVAATLGWEWLVERWELESDNWEKRTYGGPSLGLEAGIDLAVAPRFTLGAFLGASLGVYTAQWSSGEEPTTGGYSDAVTVGSPAVHGWVTALGLRGTFDLGL